MELWIRSQDKIELMKTEYLIYNADADNDFNMLDTYSIGSIKENKVYQLGTYKTKERALEVLDEIQNHNNWINKYGIKDCEYTYEMPKD